MSPALAGRFFTTSTTWEVFYLVIRCNLLWKWELILRSLEPRLRWKLRDPTRLSRRQNPKRYTVTGVTRDKQKLKFKRKQRGGRWMLAGKKTSLLDTLSFYRKTRGREEVGEIRPLGFRVLLTPWNTGHCCWDASIGRVTQEPLYCHSLGISCHFSTPMP